MTPEEKQDLLNAICRRDFDAFAARAFTEVNPGVKYEWNWHIQCLAEHLQAIEEGRLPDGKKRLCVNVPPRSLKSYLGSIAFPAWVLGRSPHKKFIATSFNATLAKEMAQKARILMESDWYKSVFPETVLDDTQNEKHNFWTTKRGMYFSSAIMSVTGRGADYVILDDPINPKEAYSETIRTNTNAEIAATIPTRFNDLREAKWLMIMQRLHEDDPTGHFALSDPRWHVLKLPGINRTSVDISYSLGDKRWDLRAGELLFPERLTKQVLEDLEKDMTPLNFAGQILQEPVPIGGGELRPEWINHYPQGSVRPHDMNIVILVDSAGGDTSRKKKMSDYTAMVVVGLASDNNYYLLDIVRDRLNPTDRINMLFFLHRKWNSLSGKPPKVGYEKYGMMTDTHYIQQKQNEDSYRFPLIELAGNQMSKEDRIRRLIPDMQNGRWYFPNSLLYVDGDGRKFDLVQEILGSEMRTFPRSKFDDMIDALSRIKDPELSVSFPRQKTGMVAKAINSRHNNSGDNWRDW